MDNLNELPVENPVENSLGSKSGNEKKISSVPWEFYTVAEKYRNMRQSRHPIQDLRDIPSLHSISFVRPASVQLRQSEER